MNPINNPSIRTSAAATATVTPSANQAASIPSTHFTHYHVLGDGDCLFRAMHMGLVNQPGLEPSEEQVMGLRQYLANYVYQNQNALVANPAFEGRQGVLNLYDLLLTPGQWNHNAGDLVAPLLAQVSGRPLAILQPTQEGAAYNVRQVFPAENPSLPAGLAHAGEPAICLAHINGNHYGYLEERYPDVLSNALNSFQHASEPVQPLDVPVFAEHNPVDMDENNLSIKTKWQKKISDKQAKEVAQLWLANPSWGNQRVMAEFNKAKPGAQVSISDIRNVKAFHPSLRGASLGAKKQERKLNDAQEQEVFRLLRANPSWGYAKVSHEFNKLHSDLKISPYIVRGVKARHLSSLGPSTSAQKFEKRLNDEQEREMAQLWLNNPRWGERRIAKEFAAHNPGIDITRKVSRGLKDRYPDLRSLGLGSTMKAKTLSNEQEQAAIQLWRENPKWSEVKFAQEYLLRNPGQPMTRGVAYNLKYRHPDLKDLGIGPALSLKKLSPAQEKALVDLCQQNLIFGSTEISREFNKLNLGVAISKDYVYKFVMKHPDLKQRSLLRATKDIPVDQRRENMEKLLSLLDSKMQSMGPSVQMDKQTKQQYEGLLKRYYSLQRTIKSLDLSQALSVNNTSTNRARDSATLQNSPNLAHQEQNRLEGDNRVDEQTAGYFIPEEDTRSQSTFAALSDIMDMDDLSNEPYVLSDDSDDDSSQGTFDGLDDFEDVSILRG